MIQRKKKYLSEVTIAEKLQRKDASRLIAQGTPHVHSCAFGEQDVCVRVTQARLSGQHAKYPWHPEKPQVRVRIRETADRAHHIQSILDTLFYAERNSIRDNIKLILEELTSNALYHSIKRADGTALYRRNQSHTLKESEYIELACHRFHDGAFISVTDRGGALKLEDIGRCLERCYSKQGVEQIEKKEGGAGLGFFMIFENVTHLEIVVTPKWATEVNLWLPLSGSIDPSYFSFNFWGETHVTK